MATPSRRHGPPGIPSVFRQGEGSRASGSRGPGDTRAAQRQRPPSLAELGQAATSGKHAAALRIDSTTPIQRYLVGSEALEKQAKQALEDERGADLVTAFIALVKMCKLLIDVLPAQHRGYSKLDANEKKDMQQRGQKAMDQLSKIKVQLVDEFEEWRRENPDEELGEWSLEQYYLYINRMRVKPSSSESKLEQTPMPPRPPKIPVQAPSPTIEYKKPAHQSTGFDVRDILGHAKPTAERAAANNALPLEPKPQPYIFTSDPLRPFTHSHSKQPSLPSDSRRSNVTFSVNYPTLKPARSVRMSVHQVAQGFAPRSEQTYKYYQIGSSNDLQPSDGSVGVTYPSIGVSSRDSRQKEAGAHTHQKGSTQSVEAQAHALLAHAAATNQAMTEGGDALRSLIIPSTLISRFVAIAAANTERNLETCGLLMGQVYDEHGARDMDGMARNGWLSVTTLLVPKQSATSDRCDTEDEESIWAFMDKSQLVTLGWIHTHPKQSCFMSSLDLHTHASYQATLPEAVAIVCAPNDEPSFGLFRLTAPFGLQTILNCREPGLFHPHVTESGETIQAIYTDAVNGHVLMTDAPLSVTDLRA